VNWITKYNQLRNVNVLATLDLLIFSFHLKLKPFFFISTISTSDPNKPEGYHLDPNIIFNSSAYALSKWISEMAVIRASSFG
jgi:thioester reductase-like protein